MTEILLTKTQRDYIEAFDAINEKDDIKTWRDEKEAKKVFPNRRKDKDEMVIDLIRDCLDEKENSREEEERIRECFDNL